MSTRTRIAADAGRAGLYRKSTKTAQLHPVTLGHRTQDAGMPADRALTEAKRTVIKTFSGRAVPYYWAAFTMQGEWK